MILGSSILVPDRLWGWGVFYYLEYCPRGSWAYGFKQRVEPNQGSGDDTALNAVRLYCRTKDNANTGSVSSYDGLWGSWSGGVFCDTPSRFMVSAAFKIEGGSASDFTGANSFKSQCQDINTLTNANGYLEDNNGGPWGTWAGEDTCPSGTAICGISSFFYKPSGLFTDDLAMTGAVFVCCRF